jgi:hypothetical protein
MQFVTAMERMTISRHLRSLIPQASARRKGSQQRQTARQELGKHASLNSIDAYLLLRIIED